MKRVVFIASITFITFGTEAQKLRVAVASSLLLPFQEIEAAYENGHGIEVDLISGSSGSLTTQILNGAPYDIFISANRIFPEKLFDQGLCLAEPGILFSGQVYLWSKSEIADDLPQYLRSPNYNRLAIANPGLAPFGATSKNWLDRIKIWSAVEFRLVIGNAISQVNHYIATNAVDLALTSNSAAYSSQLKDRGFWYSIAGPDIALVPYFMVIMASTKSPEATEGFHEFLNSEESLTILKSYGFIIQSR